MRVQLEKIKYDKKQRMTSVSSKAPRQKTVKEVLIAQKQANDLSAGTDSQDEDETEHKLSLYDVVEEGNDIATIRKANVFSGTVTSDEQKIIEQRVKQQQKQFQFFEERDKQQKYSWIKRIHPYITESEALEAIKLCDGDEVH